MEQFFNILKDYWPLILFVCGGIGGAVMYLINLIKMKIPSLDRRIKKIEENVFDDKGNEMIMDKDDCVKERGICSGNICVKLDKLESIIRGTSKDTKDSIERSQKLASANVKDLHEKRENTTKEIKKEIASVVSSVNKQILDLTLAIGNIQGEMKRIKTGSML